MWKALEEDASRWDLGEPSVMGKSLAYCSLSQLGVQTFSSLNLKPLNLINKPKEKVKMLVTQSCPALCNPMDCSLPGSSVHGILQARILESVATPFSRGSSWTWDWTQVFSTAGRFFTISATLKLETSILIKFIKPFLYWTKTESFGWKMRRGAWLMKRFRNTKENGSWEV